MLKRLELFEHQTVRIDVPLRDVDGDMVTVTESEFLELVKFNDEHNGRFFSVGHRRFSTTHHVGYVEVGNLAIEILPKADRLSAATDSRPWRAGLLEMLRVAANLRLHSPDRAAQSSARSSLIELVAARFLDETERLLHEGLSKGYRGDDTNSSTFRGKLLFTEHFRANVARADRFYVRHSIYDHDRLVNQILLEALGALRFATLTPATAARSNACRSAFPQVSGLRCTPEIFERLGLNRSTARYRDALVLARLILERSSPQLRSGRAGVFALLFDMNVLWERYVAALFRRYAKPGTTISTQESQRFWKAQSHRARTVRPDIVVREGERVVMVVDTKWKALGNAPPSDDDLRQLFVYNELFRAPRAILVYPGVSDAKTRKGYYAGREHTCETLHLRLLDGGRWNQAAFRQQLSAMFEEGFETSGRS